MEKLFQSGKISKEKEFSVVLRNHEVNGDPDKEVTFN